MEAMRAQYKVTNPDALALFGEIVGEINTFNKAAADISKKYGFECAHEREGRLIGFSIPKERSMAFRRDAKLDLWVPHERSTKGKVIREEMDAIRYRPLGTALNDLFGLDWIPGGAGSKPWETRMMIPVWAGRLGEFLIANIPFNTEKRQDKKVEALEGFTPLTPAQFLELADTLKKKNEG